MRTFNLVFVITIIIIMVTACEKEENNSINKMPTHSIKEKSNLNHNKSYVEYNIMDTMAMAANIETIEVLNNKNYSISLYNNETYFVNINTFNDEVLIDMDIEDPLNNVYNVTINPLAEIISISNIGEYTFSQYEDYVISTSENMIKNLMVIMTIHHGIQPNTSRDFDDNGDKDEFDPNPAELKFWGKNTMEERKVGGVEGTPCYSEKIIQKSRFWIKYGKPYAEIDYSNPIPCE